MGNGKILSERCSYCNQAMDVSGASGSSCAMCEMTIPAGRPHIMLVSEKGIYHYCGIGCMSSHEEFLEYENGDGLYD